MWNWSVMVSACVKSLVVRATGEEMLGTVEDIPAIRFVAHGTPLG